MIQAQQHSTFVTVVAWIFIVLSGFGTIIAFLQNIMVWTMFRNPEVGQAMQAPPQVSMPSAITFMLNHFDLFVLAFLLIAVFTLTSSIGLLKRKNWARLSFVGIMVLGILWNLGGLVVQFSMFSSIQREFSIESMHDGQDMQIFFVGIAVVSVLFAVGSSVLFGWIAKRLTSSAVVAEFRR
ncbi:hypothetical protein AGMMS50256_13000 [Betaproteobacteria bacterium]|nr:hypothetical protein AGMMS50256_13000 [Betaproteobacteria bacterium]